MNSFDRRWRPFIYTKFEEVVVNYGRIGHCLAESATRLGNKRLDSSTTLMISLENAIRRVLAEIEAAEGIAPPVPFLGKSGRTIERVAVDASQINGLEFSPLEWRSGTFGQAEGSGRHRAFKIKVPLASDREELRRYLRGDVEWPTEASEADRLEFRAADFVSKGLELGLIKAWGAERILIVDRASAGARTYARLNRNFFSSLADVSKGITWSTEMLDKMGQAHVLIDDESLEEAIRAVTEYARRVERKSRKQIRARAAAEPSSPADTGQAEANLLRENVAGWEIVWNGKRFALEGPTLVQLRGLRAIATLMRAPGERYAFYFLDWVAGRSLGEEADTGKDTELVRAAVSSVCEEHFHNGTSPGDAHKRLIEALNFHHGVDGREKAPRKTVAAWWNADGEGPRRSLPPEGGEAYGKIADNVRKGIQGALAKIREVGATEFADYLSATLMFGKPYAVYAPSGEPSVQCIVEIEGKTWGRKT